VSALRLAGATVDVRTADLADPAAVQRLVADVLAAYSRIDVCVHGAGVEESRPLAEKDDAAFRRVFDGKAEGGLALVNELPDTTFFLSMGSIAGRFGNPGQVDYSAANEAMAQLCLRRPESLHICWTAWGDVGMAVRGGMENLLTERGVELLPAGPGASLTVALLDAGTTGEIIVAGKLGGFPLPALHPLCDSVTHEGDTVIVRRTMSQASEPWMADHAIDGVWVLPGVIGLELMAAAALLACPHGQYLGAEDVRFSAPLKLHREEPVEVEIRATPTGDGLVRCTLLSSRQARTGRMLSTSHFEASIHIEDVPMLPALPSTFLPDEPIASREIYRRFFHGQSFQVLRGVESIALQGLFAEARVEHATIADGLLTDPLVLEAAFQAAGLHRMAIHGVMALPSAVDTIERLSPVIEGDTLNVTVFLRTGADGAELYDIDVDGTAGRVLRVRGFRLIDRGPLPPADRLPVPEGGWASVGTASVVNASELPPGEHKAMTARGAPRRQADRLAGQTAARRAVAALVQGGFGIERLASGAPVVLGPDGRALDVHVSISHHGGRAWAVASTDPVGIDVEAVEARSEAFREDWFHASEPIADDTDLTIAWAIKEAVLKRLGVGMAASPRDVVVGRVAATWSVTLAGELAGRSEALSVTVRRWTQDGEELVGVIVAARVRGVARRVA
jgi:phosphopantetheinyl transferase